MGAGMEGDIMQRIFRLLVNIQKAVEAAVLAANPRIPELSRTSLSIIMWQFARVAASSQGKRNSEAPQVTPPTVPARGPVGDEGLGNIALNRMQRSIDAVPMARDQHELTLQAVHYVPGEGKSPGESTPVFCRIYAAGKTWLDKPW